MENVKIKLNYMGGAIHTLIPLNFQFVRERYTPYTTLQATAVYDCDISKVNEIELYYNDKLLHRGMTDYIERKYENGRSVIKLMSRSFSMLLGQNEPIPGMIYNVTLSDLITSNTNIPYLQWQSGTKTVNYIYVKEKSTIWDAICAYSYKVYKCYPYIQDSNTVCVSVPDIGVTQDYSYHSIISITDRISTTGILSNVYMSNSEGEYCYSKTNLDASSRNIVRKKYYPLDRQWYANPDEGLTFKLNYSNRGVKAFDIKYKGHKFENLMDHAIYRGNNYTIERDFISAVEVTGNKNGVFTKISIYKDSYSGS